MGRGKQSPTSLKPVKLRSKKTATKKKVVVDDYPLTLGLIDDAAREYFSEGQCHSLAVSAAKRYNWDIAIVFDGDFPVHMVNVLPTGDYLDIFGKANSKDLLDDFAADKIKKTSLDKVIDMVESNTDGFWQPVNYSIAKSYLESLEELSQSGRSREKLRERYAF